MSVTKAKDRGWDTLSNGDLLDAAEADGFEGSELAQERLEGRLSDPSFL